ncbi:hypothetical protein GWI33_000785 [Rhynchophorus ferrugineus]|uniref:DOMON domain-containing protein n=1 Tax=Rhynchophorus ferrugineus TaxID=354439 RepID=A0A834HZ14_RHYFE|nr:hypothetical protein GWI33_000785 [Rhynchophorus ferrugineus]
MKLFVLTVIVVVLCETGVLFCSCEKNEVFHLALNGDNTISLHWILNYSEDEATLEIHLPAGFGWFAFGFSDRGEFYPADYCVLWRTARGKYKLMDTHADAEGVLGIDKSQNCNGFRVKTRNGVVKFTFKRKFDTCDPLDYIIEEGTTHVVWSRGFEMVPSIRGLNISTETRENHGMNRVTLLKNLDANTELPRYVTTLDLSTDKVRVPPIETTYWCRVFKLPKEFHKKHHIYQYEANIQDTSEGLVHHMEIFHCEADPDKEIPLYNGDCFSPDRPQETMVCKRVLAAWAMGALPFTYPEEAALPLGGEGFNPYVMLEIHYNNPELKSGFVDSSGIRFHVSDKLREMDAGIIELGLEYTDKMAIPPGQELFSLTGYCISSCTSVIRCRLEEGDFSSLCVLADD